MPNSNLKKTAYGFYILSAVAAMVFIALGFWQLQRLHEKESMLAALKNFNPSLADMSGQLVGQSVDQYKIFSFTVRRGLLDQTKPVFRPGAVNPYASPNISDRMGYNLYMPLVDGDQAILVDFGWIDQGMRDLIESNARQKKVQKIPVTISGWVMRPAGKKTFTPDNDPLLNAWYWQDFSALGQYSGYQYLPFVLYNTINWHGGNRPPVWDNIPNNHRQYVWTWFCLAAVQVVANMFYWKKERNAV